MDRTVKPTDLRKNIYSDLDDVIENKTILNVPTKKGEVVIINRDDWNSIKETLYLESTGVLDKIRDIEKNETEDDFFDLDELDWDKI